MVHEKRKAGQNRERWNVKVDQIPYSEERSQPDMKDLLQGFSCDEAVIILWSLTFHSMLPFHFGKDGRVHI